MEIPAPRAVLVLDSMTPTDPPPGLIPVPLKGAVLLLTQAEYLAGIRRGKCWRRQRVMEQRASSLLAAPGAAVVGGAGDYGDKPAEAANDKEEERQDMDDGRSFQA